MSTQRGRARRRSSSPTTGGTALAPTCCMRRSASSPRPRPGCSTWAARTGRACRGCAATTTSPSTSTRAGLRPGEGVCASALSLPFRDGSFDLASAFDVVEHCEPESVAAGRARPGARSRRSAAAVGAGLPVGVVRPRRAGRSPPALHPAAAGLRGGGCGVRRTSGQLRLRRGVPAVRGRAAGPSGQEAGRHPRAAGAVRRGGAGAARALAGRGAVAAGPRRALRLIGVPGRRQAGALTADLHAPLQQQEAEPGRRPRRPRRSSRCGSARSRAATR